MSLTLKRFTENTDTVYVDTEVIGPTLLIWDFTFLQLKQCVEAGSIHFH